MTSHVAEISAGHLSAGSLCCALLVMLPMMMVGCGGDSASDAGQAEDDRFAVKRSYGAGPVLFELALSSDTITTADVLLCRMTLDVAGTHEADFPDIVFADDMSGVILTGYDETETATEQGRVIRTRTYELEPEVTGTLTLPAMEIWHHEKEAVAEEDIQTEPIEVTVESTGTDSDALTFRPVRELVTLEQIEAAERRVWPCVLASSIGLVLIIGLIIWRMRRPRVAPPPPPAHVVALERLEKLRAGGWIDRGLAEPFFIEVTGIVRDYIEDGFGVRAPEQTTDEFLAGLHDEPRVARYRESLQPFLTAADMVKFACHVPDREAMQQAFATAESFVRQSSEQSEGGV